MTMTIEAAPAVAMFAPGDRVYGSLGLGTRPFAGVVRHVAADHVVVALDARSLRYHDRLCELVVQLDGNPLLDIHADRRDEPRP